MEVKDLDQMHNLRKRLRHDSDRLGYVHDPTPMKGNRSTNLINTVLFEMQGRRVGDAFCNVDDVIKGVARLDHYSTTREEKNIALSTKRMYAILQTMEVINTREVMKLLGVGDRQARRYVKACKLALPYLEDVLTEDLEGLDIDDYVMKGATDFRCEWDKDAEEGFDGDY